jgi:1-acyl-sn-glycerol-3-phosphate acyltransferase
MTPRPAASLPLRMLTYLVLMPLIAASTTFFGCISLLCGIWDKSGRQQHAIARVWAQTLLWFALSPVTVVGLERLGPDLKSGGAAVYASNHLSYYDTPVLFAKLPFQFRILAKQGLWKVPFIGWYLNRSGQVSVDQKDNRSAIASLGRGVKALQAGMPLMLFPEGGRAAEGHLQPFMSGSAFMAIKAGVPLVPIALIGTYELLPIHTYHLSPRPLLAVIGDPIPTVGLTTRDANALTEKLQQAISAMYHLYQPPSDK